MMKTNTIDYNNIPVRFAETGSGTPVVLLHGYLENLMIWNGFASALSDHARVITIDLPGHGETGCPGDTSSMDFMAETVKAVLDHLKINHCYLFGHSMGGYVTLAFAENYPNMLKGFSLFHSVATADPEKKKKARLESIKKVEEGKKDEIIMSHVPRTFATDNIDDLRAKIIEVTRDSLKTPADGIIAALRGMMERPDRTNILKNTQIPVLFFIGEKDNFIPVEKALEQASLSEKIQVIRLNNSGHMGHIEEKEESLNAILNFIKND